MTTAESPAAPDGATLDSVRTDQRGLSDVDTCADHMTDIEASIPAAS